MTVEDSTGSLDDIPQGGPDRPIQEKLTELRQGSFSASRLSASEIQSVAEELLDLINGRASSVADDT